MNLKLLVTALFVSTALATNYALIWIPNVKLMDAIIMLTSYAFGLFYGILAAVSIWAIYGSLNPYGFNFLTFFIVISGEMFYVLFGLILRKILPFKISSKIIDGKLTIVSLFALISTILYDLYTNALVGIIWYNSAMMGILTMNFPYPFGIFHEISNLIIIPVVISSGVFLMRKWGIIHE